MNFEKFAHETEKYIKKLKKEQPLALILSGDGFKKENYIDNITEQEIFFINHEMPSSFPKISGLGCFFIKPEDVITMCINNETFMMWNAIFHGKVIYDPTGFVASIKENLREKKFEYLNKILLKSTVDYIGQDMSSAINRYFSKDSEINKNIFILRNLYSVVTEIGQLCSIIYNEEPIDGYTQIAKSIKDTIPELTELMLEFQNVLRCTKDISTEKKSKVIICPDDDIGNLIVAVEDIYVNHMPLIPLKKSTNFIIETYQHQYGKLKRTCYVRINNETFSHYIIGKDSSGVSIFGIIDTKSTTFEKNLFKNKIENKRNLYTACKNTKILI